MDVQPTLHNAALLHENRGRSDVAGDDPRGLQLGTLRGKDVSGDRAADDDLASGHVADNRRALTDHDQVGAMDGAFEAPVDAKRAVGLVYPTELPEDLSLVPAGPGGEE